jgi:hypothetical protein
VYCTATGILIDENTVSTAAHCVWSGIYDKIVAVQVIFCCETNPSCVVRFGTHAAVHIRWYCDSDGKHDIGLIRLDSSVDTARVVKIMDQAPSEVEEITIPAYTERQNDMSVASGSVDFSLPYQLWQPLHVEWPERWKHEIDTYRGLPCAHPDSSLAWRDGMLIEPIRTGNSGAGLLVKPRQMAAIHTFGDESDPQNPFNLAVSIHLDGNDLQALKVQFQKSINELPPSKDDLQSLEANVKVTQSSFVFDLGEKPAPSARTWTHLRPGPDTNLNTIAKKAHRADGACCRQGGDDSSSERTECSHSDG